MILEKLAPTGKRDSAGMFPIMQRAQICRVASRSQHCDSALGFTLVCHSEEACDEESAFSFPDQNWGKGKADASQSLP
jgi:hypothetical protein